MLVLSRKRNESIVINHNVAVTVLRIQGSHVTIGVEAPAKVRVYRKEVYEKIRELALVKNVTRAPR